MDNNETLIHSILGEKYEIKNLIQSGGMGEIFLGIHKALGKKVAIKIIHQELVKNETIRSRFYQEAKLAAGFNHPGIIDIYDFGSGPDFDYIIMPFIEGENLQQRINKRGPFAPAESVRIMIEIADALHYAHSHKVVHRDIKPSNIMFDSHDKIIIADFGISKDLGNNDITVPNTFMGSPGYMSPEQIKGVGVDARSDLYSLGLVFYEMLTGSHPFKGRDATSVYYAQVHEMPPRPESLRPDIPMALSRIIMKLLKKNPNNRYPDGAALLKDLQAYQSGKGIMIFGENDASDTILMNNAPIIEDTFSLDNASGSIDTIVMGGYPPYQNSLKQPSPLVPSGGFFRRNIRVFAWGGAALLVIFSVIVFLRESPSTKKTIRMSSPGKVMSNLKAPIPSTPKEPMPSSHSLIDTITAASNGKTAVDLSIRTSRNIYHIGETIHFYFMSKKSCYLVMLVYNTKKELIQIFPNRDMMDQLIHANFEYTIPDNKMGFDLEVRAPVGQEDLIALVSDTPFQLFGTAYPADQPFIMFNEQDLSQRKKLYNALSELKNLHISQKRLTYRIED